MKKFVYVFLVGNEEVCSCVFVKKSISLFICLWWEMNELVIVFMLGNGEVRSCVSGDKWRSLFMFFR